MNGKVCVLKCHRFCQEHRLHYEFLQLQELRQKTDEFEQITASMNEGLVLLDKNGTVISINAAEMVFDEEIDELEKQLELQK